MNINKLIKNQLKESSQKNPEKYFPVELIKKYGFSRYKCSSCSVNFWSCEKKDICGDTSCVKKYSFIGDSPCKNTFTFVETWKEWEKFMKKRGYLSVKRFPTIARWRDDLDFNIASIIGFQPYVTKGEVAPPNSILTIPQPCLRFGDIDNVGYSGRHHTGYTMIGQCAFEKPENYDQEKYFKDFMDYFLEVCKIPINEITIQEDAWLGGGDCGASLEFFVRGLELANQVYMWFDMSDAKNIDEIKPLKIKVLDMGMGQERICWLSNGEINTYQANMPEVCNFLFEKTNLSPNDEVYQKFLPFSGTLNLDEVDDIEEEWKKIGEQLNIDTNVLKSKIEKIAAIYGIADYTRTLLYAIFDGGLPSNVKGGYNLRIILRKSLDFIKKFEWNNIDLFELIKIHAKSLEEIYPEFNNEKSLLTIKKILENEKIKFENHKLKIDSKLKTLKSELNENDFVKYYISDGITPTEIQNYFLNEKKIEIQIPNNFYSKVNSFFEEQKTNVINKKNKNLIFEEHIKDIKDTELIYYKDMYKYELEDVQIIKKFEIDNQKFIILNKTVFYPTGGGQLSDIGEIENEKIVDVFKVKGIVIHKVK